jgi:hypothetical protein
MAHEGIIFSIEWLYLTIIYVILVVVSAAAQCLYFKAYLEMKRSPMIKSVVILLTTILIENFYFLSVAIARGYEHALVPVLENPIAWSIPKLFMLYGLYNFIRQSITPTDVTDIYSIGNPRKKKEEEKKKV